MLQPIEALTPPAALAPGLAWSYIETKANTASDIANARIAATGHAVALDIKGIAKRPGDYVIVFDGFVEVPTAGEWRFSAKANDRCRVLISDLPIMNSIGTSLAELSSIPVQLEKGLHPIRVELVQWGGSASLELSWTGPGQPKQSIPASLYRRKP